MAKAGRKRKQGRREKNGRLLRNDIPRYDRGTEHAQAMQALYGQDGCDAIGRAYRAGLLGEGNEAKALLDLGRAISNTYWASAETHFRVRCAIGDRSGGTVVDLDHERELRREQWLNGCLNRVRSMGDSYRRAFDQLVIDVNPDCGPDWLDRLLRAKPDTRALSDMLMMARAIDGMRDLVR